MRYALAAFLVCWLLTASGSAGENGRPPVAKAPAPNTWAKVDSAKLDWCGMVYSPERGRVLRWGCGFGSGERRQNEVRSFDTGKLNWEPDHAGDEFLSGRKSARVLNTFYGSDLPGLLLKSGRPGPYLLFDQLVYDSKRKRMIAVMRGKQAAYDPLARTWEDMKASTELYGKRLPGGPPAKWGSAVYDPVNDEILCFAHFALSYNYDHWAKLKMIPGHLGTLVYSFKDNTWRRPKFPSPALDGRRGKAEDLLGEARLTVARRIFAVVIAAHNKGRTDVGPARKALDKLLEGTRKLAAEVAAAKADEYEAGRLKRAGKNLSLAAGRLEKSGKLLAAGKATEAHMAFLDGKDLLRRAWEYDLASQPVGRVHSPLAFDQRNRVIIMFGGDRLDECLGDTWVYDCRKKRWFARHPRVSPPPRAGHGLAWDTKRGLAVMAGGYTDIVPRRRPTGNARNKRDVASAWCYDADKNEWFRLAADTPTTTDKRGRKLGPGVSYMAYDRTADLLVLASAERRRTYVMRLDPGARKATGEALKLNPPKRERFPLEDDPAVVARLKSMPANTWVRANPPREPIFRIWTTMTYDPELGCAVYFGGGHLGYHGSDVEAYFPGANRWAMSHWPHFPPPPWRGQGDDAGNWQTPDGRDMAHHVRWYVCAAGRLFRGGGAAFSSAPYCPQPFWAKRSHSTWKSRHVEYYDWAVRGAVVEMPKGYVGARPLGVREGRFAGFAYPYRGLGPKTPSYYELDPTRNAIAYKALQKPIPPRESGEGHAACYVPGHNVILLNGKGKGANETWCYDVKANTFRNLNPKEETPSVGMGYLFWVPDAEVAVCVTQSTKELYAYSFKHNTWKVLPTEGKKELLWKTGFVHYGNIVYDPRHKMIVHVSSKTNQGVPGRTMLLRPDFSKIKWGTK